MENNDEWVSVSTLAAIIGKSKQTVYNRIKDGVYETKTFRRGTMKGVLIKNPNL